MKFTHQTVLRDEVVDLLAPQPGKRILDATLGGGGHAEALLDRGAEVVGVDRDPAAVRAATARLGGRPGFRALVGDAGELETLLGPLGLVPADGLLADLGVSSPQLEDPARGFSFQTEGPLDMRMGEGGLTAAEAIARADEATLARVLRDFGQEPFAGRIARALLRARPETTLEAVEAVKRAVPRRAWPHRTHVATRTFQALRIWVNDELGALDRLLAALPRLLRVGGRAAVIAFHSLEDQRVKQAFRALVGRCTCPPGLPVCACGAGGSFTALTSRAVKASAVEVARNPRARSARLRAVERVR
ncbi:MAG TPA: 16S rRNA (cytosine(1402)-N(4))-methyltransferase RsmH [Myxococcaceae bacterium]|nr:16S rRNA (cytosine(1402)-N(4))-methyltransferase RsmH [Myxococcaceae bacterium]